MSDPDQSRSALARLWDALGGLCIGAVAGYQFLPALLSFERAQALGSLLGLKLAGGDMFWFLPAIGAAIGVVGALVWGRISDARAVQRVAALQEVVQRRGQQFSADVDGELSGQLVRDFSLHDAAISSVLRKELPAARLIVGELAIGSEVRQNDRHETRWTSQTAAYFTADVPFPKFTLQAETVGTKLLTSVVGVEDIDFPSHPDFSRHYHLHAVHPDNARRLFDARLLDHLGRRPGLRVESARNTLLVYRPATQVSAQQMDPFIAETTEIFNLLEASARKLQEAIQAGLVPKVDARAAAERLPGMLGKEMRASLVTRSDLQAFIAQPPPRRVPANIRRYCENFAPLMVLGIGAAFFLVGSGFMVGSALAGRWDGAVFGLLFVAVGGGMLFFLGRIRLRLERVLRHGRLGTGRIESLEPAGWGRTGGDMWWASVRFGTEAGSAQAKCYVAAAGLERSQNLFKAKKPAAVLYDPANPQRFVLVEALLTVSPEYEE